MTRPCQCTESHPRKRVVLTGGPGAGKTAVLEIASRVFCKHVVTVPEAASLLFRGGFPRGNTDVERRARQRAIFHVQRELENASEVSGTPAIALCDRGTVDGAAYWPGPESLWSEVGTDEATELARYALVIHLRVPDALHYDHSNGARIETPEQAAALDDRIAQAWRGHPRRVVIEATSNFLDKANHALWLIADELPPCCRSSSQPPPRP